jgi:perosamine synthetase
VSKLALLGGLPVRRVSFAPRQTICEADKRAVAAVMDSGVLSGFYGSPGAQFLGGPKVREFEAIWAEKFRYRHAISVNSGTSGLIAAIGAIGIGPGDEVICSPYTMSASATCVLFYGGVPVFADIDPDTMCLDPHSISMRITPRTKAIAVVHLFGRAAPMDEIVALARRHGLKVIEDAAQAPGAIYDGRPVGALGDIGVFSLNYHKHIHTGEGGVIVTDNDELAERCRMIRNHGENIIEASGLADISNLIGANYRLTEMQAAIGIEQLKRLDGILALRRDLARHLTRRLAGLPGLKPFGDAGSQRHAYYVFDVKYDADAMGVPREEFAAAVNAELPAPVTSDDLPFQCGYVKPLYLNPVYQKRIALGRNGFPFDWHPEARLDYTAGLCPVAERMHGRELMISFLVRDPLTAPDMNDFAAAITKVVENRADLRDSRWTELRKSA